MFPNLYYFSALRITGSFFFSYLEIYVTSLWAVVRLLCCRTVHPSPAVRPHPCACCLPPCAWHIFAALRDHCSLSLRSTLLVCFCFCKRGSTAFVFLCPTYFIYYNILHFHLFSHKWQDFWLASCIVLLPTFCSSVHPSMHTAIESFPWLLYNKHGVHEPLLHWFHLV